MEVPFGIDKHEEGRKMKYEDERKTIIEACKAMQALGYFLGTWGNISVRIGDEIVLTPSRVSYDTMAPEDMVVIDMDGNKTDGNSNPTSEKEVHRLIYREREDIRGIVHCHSLYATAAACAGFGAIPPLMEEMSQLLGGGVPVTKRYVPAEQHHELGLETAKTIDDKNAVLMRNHGPVCCGRDIEEAVLVSRVVEKACRIYLLLKRDASPETIEEQFVKSERYRYLYKYGKENA
jgi:L-ribulose-5-phosphate 4-epimerase